jgi:hypothetical protein
MLEVSIPGIMIDEMGIETGVDIYQMLCLGRVFEWTMEKSLPVSS